MASHGQFFSKTFCISNGNKMFSSVFGAIARIGDDLKKNSHFIEVKMASHGQFFQKRFCISNGNKMFSSVFGAIANFKKTNMFLKRVNVSYVST